MSGVSSIGSALRAELEQVSGPGARLARARDFAASLADRAAGHGWTGVASGLRDVESELASGVSQFDDFHRAGTAAAVHLGLVGDQSSVDEVLARLGEASDELATSLGKLAATVGTVGAATAACAGAGQKGLSASLVLIRADLLRTGQRVERAQHDCDTAKRSLMEWLSDSPDSGSPKQTRLSGPAVAAPYPPTTSGDEVSTSHPDRTPRRTAGATEFDVLVDPRGAPRAARPAEPVAIFFTAEEFKRQRADEARWPAPSRGRQRVVAVGTMAAMAAEATIGSALNLGGSMGQAIGGLFFGTVAYFVAVPEFKRTWRETKPKHQAGRNKKERGHGKG
jgi:hypothetical protein